MISLRINDKDLLELDTKNAINVTLTNPALDTQAIARNYSYPQRLPLTNANRVALHHQHRLDSRSRKKVLPADILIGGQQFDRGRATIDEHTDTNSRLVFQNQDLASVDLLSQLKIRDLLDNIDIPQTASVFYELTPSAGPNWRITINTVLYTAGGLGVDVDTAMQNLVADINVDYPAVASYNVVSGLFMLSTDLEEFVLGIFNDFTVASEQTLSDARELNLQAYITAAAAGAEAVAFPAVYAPNFYPRNFRWRSYLNHRIGGSYLTNGYDAELGWATTYVPFVRLRHVLDRIAAQAGLSGIIFDLPTAQAADMNAILIYNNLTLDDIRLENSLTFGEKEKNTFLTTITTAEHVPDYTAQQLLQRIAGSFNLHLRFERGALYLRANIKQVQQPPKDWTSITEMAYQRTTTQGGGVTIQFEEDTDEAAAIHAPFTVGDGSNTLTLPFRPLQDRTATLFEAANARWKTAAIIDQLGTSKPLDLETENQTLRLFFDRGQQTNETGQTYWMGTSGTTDYDNNTIGDISLDINTNTGLYPKSWRGWTQLLFSPTITRVVALTIDQLLAIKRWVNTLVTVYHPEGTTTGVVKEVQFKASNQGVGKSKVTFQKYEP